MSSPTSAHIGTYERPDVGGVFRVGRTHQWKRDGSLEVSGRVGAPLRWYPGAQFVWSRIIRLPFPCVGDELTGAAWAGELDRVSRGIGPR